MLPTQSVRTRKILYILYGILILALALTNLFSLGDYPGPNCDEALLSSSSYNLFASGRFRTDLAGDVRGYNISYLNASRLYGLLQGVLFLLFDHTLFIARLFSYIGWILAAVFVFLVADRELNRPTALISSLVFAANLNAFYASHIARQEIWVVVGAMGIVYYYYIIIQSPTNARYFLLGLMLALVLELHLNTVYFGLAIAFHALAHNVSRRDGRIRLVLAFAGGLIGLAIFVGYRLFPDPQLAIYQYKIIASSNDLLAYSLASFFGRVFGFVVSGYILNFNYGVIIFTIYSLLSVLYTLIEPERLGRRLLFIWGISALLFILTQSHLNPAYRVYWSAFAALIIGYAVVQAGRKLAEKRSSLPANVLALLLIAPMVGSTLFIETWLGIKFSPRDYQSYLAEIEKLVPPDTRVLGDAVLWYGLEGRNEFVSEWYIPHCVHAPHCHLTGELTAGEVQAIIHRLDVDYVIEDGALSCRVVPSDDSRIYANYLETNCSFIGQVDDPWFGAYGQDIRGYPTRVYDCSAIP
jgi:hypothetical protein